MNRVCRLNLPDPAETPVTQDSEKRAAFLRVSHPWKEATNQRAVFPLPPARFDGSLTSG